MNAETNLEAIQGAQAATAEAANATQALTDAINTFNTAVLALFQELSNAALTAMSATEAAHQAAANAADSTEQHLNSTPGDHSTIPAIITAKNACDSAAMGLGGATDGTTSTPSALEGLTNDFTTAIGAIAASKIEEIQGLIGQAGGELGTAETNIASVKG